MLEWKPRRLLGVGLGVGIVLILLLLDGLLLGILRSRPVAFLSFVLGLLVVLSLFLAGTLGYLIYGLLRLRYLIGRDSVVISWAARQETIPLAAIESIEPLVGLGDRIRGRRFCLPGHCVGWARDDQGRRVLLYSTGPRSEELLITTADTSYVISPRNPSGFLSAVRARRRLGPAESLERARSKGGLAGLAIWGDLVAVGLAAMGALANAGLFAYIALRYPNLPGIVPLLSEAGQVTLLGHKEELWELPAIGLTVLLANTILGFALHRWERVVTYCLGAMAILVQVIIWSAAIKVMG
jgi:hypothetical protein